MKDILLLVGAGQIGMAIARRVGFDKKIIIGDKNLINAKKLQILCIMQVLMLIV